MMSFKGISDFPFVRGINKTLGKLIFLNFRKLIIFVCLMLFFTVSSSAQLNADFSIDVSSGCSPLAVQFTDLSTGAPASYQWDLGNGNKPTIGSPATIYIDPGIYNVSLTVTKGGLTSTKMKTVTVFRNPVADFSASISKGCLPLDVFFTDKSAVGSAPIKTWFWDFGDGTNDNKQSPVHTYQKAGKYKVSLIVTDNNGCTNTKSVFDYITIDPTSNTTLDFSGDTLSGCDLPFTVNFSNASTGSGLSYRWNFGDGGTSTLDIPSHTYNAGGVFDVYLVGINSAGCTDTLRKQGYINILNNPKADFSLSKVQACAFENVSFSNTSSAGGTAWTWDFGDGTISNLKNPLHSFKSAGTYNVKLTTEFGSNCTRSATKNAVITILPSGSNFTALPTAGCSAPLTVNFSDSISSNNSWAWDFGDGETSSQQNPAHTYSNFGSYTVSMITTNSKNSCIDTVRKINLINLQPSKADFTVNKRKGCIPLSVNFSDKSVSNDPIVGWKWDFGDGTTDNVQNPTHVFTTENVFDISLIITTVSGCIDTLIIPEFVKAGNPPTKVDFTSSKKIACAADFIQFTDLSQHANGWHWDFTIATDTLQNPKVHFRDTGTFPVTLIADFNGCPDTLKGFSITISPPVSLFSYHKSCDNPYKITLTDFSISPQTWTWDYGDGTPISNQRYDTVHTFASKGSYDIKLVTTYGACKDTIINTINIVEPKAGLPAGNKSGCAPLEVSFTENSVDASKYFWDFGDGFTSTLKNPVHTYSDSGDYDVTLIVDSLGCTDTTIQKKYVHIGQINADFAIDTAYGCFPLTVGFTELSKPSTGITSYLWKFGDGTTFDKRNPPPHTYSVEKDYDVTLTIETATCKDSTTYQRLIQFPAKPSPDFSISDTLTCKGSEIMFTHNSPSIGLKYLWNFGDGTTSPTFAVFHPFANDGVYPVTLKVTDANGCDSSSTKFVEIKNPEAKFGASPRFASCPNLLTNFTDSSSINVIAWNWDFGDKTGSTKQNPSHLYTSSDSNDVRLIVTTRLGCTDTMLIKNYVVIAGPKGDFSFDPLKGCPPLTVSFNSNAKNIDRYQWDFGDGTPFGMGNSTSHDFDEPGVFHPRLILTDTSGCTLAFQSPDSIVVKLLSIVAGNNKFICLGQITTLNGSGEGTTFNWTPTTGLDSASSPTPKASPAVTTTYYLNTTKGKCISKDTVTVFVNPSFPDANFTVNPVCLNDTAEFIDKSTITGTDKIKSWRWNFGGGNTSTSKDTVKFFYNSPNNYDITLTVVSDSGCVDSIKKSVQIYTIPKADFSSQRFCLTDATMFKDLSTDTSGIVARSWSFGDGVVSNIAAPTHTYPDSGSYTVRLISTSKNNCKDTIEKKVFINPLPNPDFSSSRDECFQIPFNFTDLSTIGRGSIVKRTWAFGDGDTLYDINPTHDYKSLGKFTVSLTTVSDSGCVKSITKNDWLKVYPIPTADFSIAPTTSLKLINNQFRLTDLSKDHISLVYDFGDGNSSTMTNPVHMYNDSGVYFITLKVTGGNGCSDTTVKRIYVEPDFAFYIPNTFSPNNDGANDYFIGRGIGVKKFNMIIYDRWGTLIYETNSMAKPWDGRANGGPEISQQDVYVYKIELRDVFLQTHYYSGEVYLIK